MTFSKEDTHRAILYRHYLEEGGRRAYYSALRIYYESDRWAEVREATFVRDQFTCRECKQTGHAPGNPLQGHHTKYPKNLFLEDSPDNVVTVCEKCHKKIEKEKKLSRD